jgi:hypothetical protein
VFTLKLLDSPFRLGTKFAVNHKVGVIENVQPRLEAHDAGAGDPNRHGPHLFIPSVIL